MASIGAPLSIRQAAAASRPDAFVRSVPAHTKQRIVSVWTRRYLLLFLIGVLVIAHVGFYALFSEIETLRWKLERAVTAERSRQASMTRQVNSEARWTNLEEVARQREMVQEPEGIIEIDAPAPLPQEYFTVLTTPQPFKARGEGRMEREGPTEAAAGARQP